jgi:hypothetical protein
VVWLSKQQVSGSTFTAAALDHDLEGRVACKECVCVCVREREREREREKERERERERPGCLQS